MPYRIVKKPLTLEIRVTAEEVKEDLEYYLDKKPTKKQIEDFFDHVASDIDQWLTERAKYWSNPNN